MPPRYKFVELSTVTDETLERTVNEWVELGWALDAIRFVTSESSRRPQMAFVSFVRTEPGDDAEHGAGHRDHAVPARSELRRPRTKVIELGELDWGEVEAIEAELDWDAARPSRGRRGRAASPTRPVKPAAKKRGKAR